jgi:hypothetical protein
MRAFPLIILRTGEREERGRAIGWGGGAVG